ncbi:MAG TPA: hypothetical protein VM049_01225 [Gaiellaceae bacterium]|nr:hypothetical protein [Gaiellaceae bacterium]
MHDLCLRYLELLRKGATWNYDLMSTVEHHSKWHEAIEALATADGLRVTRATEVIGAGQFLVPYVLLIRPDGGHYPWLSGERQVIGKPSLAAIESDWGELLVAARTRAETSVKAFMKRPRPSPPGATSEPTLSFFPSAIA